MRVRPANCCANGRCTSTGSGGGERALWRRIGRLRRVAPTMEAYMPCGRNRACGGHHNWVVSCRVGCAWRDGKNVGDGV